MKKLMIGVAAIALITGLSACDKKGADAGVGNTFTDTLSASYGEYVGTMVAADFIQMKTDSTPADAKTQLLAGVDYIMSKGADKNYARGVAIGSQILSEIEQLKEQQGIEINKGVVLNKFREAFANTDTLNQYAIFQMQGEFRALVDRATAMAQEEKLAKMAEAPEAQQNAVVGRDYINKLKEENSNVKTTDSGLAYDITAAGDANHPSESDRVKVHYTGRKMDGTVFDSSVGRGEPAVFPLQGVVPGFREGLMLLGKGGKATLYIPGELAYGPQGQPAADIKPNELLIFDVELIDVNPE